MSVGVVYVREKYKKNFRVSSVPWNTSCKEQREAIVFNGDVI